uniref:Photosystem II extrinsic protein V n=1 Tax=Cyanothece sp. (strain PCC 7425 / ATCC 29141) TaxID=395961 RepID=CY550_CYAP4|nr:RecName: Full=Photosystem II extrinsic protein V; Short=PsbV; AltName: Full=Cytochrome c-550; AltName: Full=Cytochrome c550; AltName: Full=Low-potential cytochrome c; Flags: Precursor [Cyanothece sp. PCC 7425]
MLKRCLWLVVTVLFAWQVFNGTAIAAQLDATTRTVALNDQGKNITLSRRQVEDGQRLFNEACASCHAGGITKTNPSLDLSPETLALATPRRDSVAGLVDYMKDPTTYDGEDSIAEIHPSIKSADIYPKMRNLSEQDLTAIAGYILVQPKVQGEKWGGGKIYF